jgi:hypothetical protein
MRFIRIGSLAIAAAAAGLASPALAHCDGLDGPVVAAARNALDSANPDPVLIWVQPRDEAEIRTAFTQALDVRKLGPSAKAMADTYFYETLVRLHRAGEGAPYTGLKPAGRDLGPAIPLADKAVVSGSDRELTAFIAKSTSDGLHAQFATLHSKRNFRPDDLAAGRAYVASYVTFVHYVEGLHRAAEARSDGHYPETDAAPAHHE